MNRSERFTKINQMLTNRKVVSRQTFLKELDTSWSSLKRDLAYMKNFFHAPIEYDRDAGGYRYGKQGVGPKFELPGLWFNADEAHALMMMHQLLSDLEPGLLTPHVAPLMSRLETLLGQDERKFSDLSKRIRIASGGRRRKNPEHFAIVSRAALERQRIKVRHYSRENNSHSDRELSPQRLVFYRNNWYLEAWCHARQDLRSFSVDAFESVEMQKEKATAISFAKLNETFGSQYGIYSGKKTQVAKLQFSPAAARWVADEIWHADQHGRLEADGQYLLEVPYAMPNELVMDILRHGADVEVISPAALRSQVAAQISRMAITYAKK